MTVYANFAYYIGTFLGTAIAEANFPRLALRASAVIDQITVDRVAPIVTAGTDTATIDKIKMATCAIAEELQKQDAVDNTDGIQSESQGNYSVSYATSSAKLKTNLQKQQDAARTWLANTFLMYPGFNAGEYGSETAS